MYILQCFFSTEFRFALSILSFSSLVNTTAPTSQHLNPVQKFTLYIIKIPMLCIIVQFAQLSNFSRQVAMGLTFLLVDLKSDTVHCTAFPEVALYGESTSFCQAQSELSRLIFRNFFVEHIEIPKIFSIYIVKD